MLKIVDESAISRVVSADWLNSRLLKRPTYASSDGTVSPRLRQKVKASGTTSANAIKAVTGAR